MTTEYVVWVGGVAECETSSFAHAKEVALGWREEGYTDVIVEEVDREHL